MRRLSVLLILFFFLTFLCEGAIAKGGLPLPSLQELEGFAGEGPELLSAMAALARDEHLERLAHERSGPKLFAGLNYGYSDEPVTETSDERISYSKVTARVGVSYPILGSWSKEKIDRFQAQLKSLKGRVFFEQARNLNLTALRKAYMVLWGESRKRKLINAFLADEHEVDAVLSKRVREGLLLEADRLEFLSAYDMVKRDLLASKMVQVQALQAIRLGTGRSWSLGEDVMEPTLPGWSSDGCDELLSVSELPEVKYQEETLELYRKILETTDRIDREGTLEVGVTGGRDFPGSLGTAVYVGVTIREPFGVINSDHDEAQLAASEDLLRERADGLVTRIRLEGELEEAQVLLEYALQSIQTGVRRVQASSESIRENRLRHAALAGDTFEKLQQSRYSYLRSALDLVDAQALMLQGMVELLRFSGSLPDGKDKVEEPRGFPLAFFDREGALLDSKWLLSATGGSELQPVTSASKARAVKISVPPASTSPERTKTVYVWRADPFLNDKTMLYSLIALKKAGFNKMLLSFNAAQVRSLKTGKGDASLRSLLSKAGTEGVRVDLLLGDPSWILPEHRLSLVNLVRFFSKFPFRGIHLDMEPDSLQGASSRREYLTAEFIRTLELVRDRTSLPLSVSLHPRYLEGKLGDIMAKGLSPLDIEDVAVMIYSTNAQAVRARLDRIRRKYPDLHLALAQSVEKVLSPSESYFRSGKNAFWSRAAYYDEAFNYDDYGGIFVQSWSDYEEMRR